MTGAAGALLLVNSSCKKTAQGPAGSQAAGAVPQTPGIGLNLYTIREAMANDVLVSLKRVSDTGYKYIELAGYASGKFYDYTPVEFRKIVKDLGMEILSSHPQVDEGITLENAKVMAEDHALVGASYCIQHWINEEDRTTLDSYKRMVANWNLAGRIMKEQGIQLGYHNHNFEFARIEGRSPYYDVILAELDRDLVAMEIDIFWATKAGQDVINIFNKYPGRFPLFHLKDMFTHEAPSYSTDNIDDFAPVGAGVINFKEILAAKDMAGMKYLIVEQDSAKDGRIFDAIRVSIANLAKLV